MTVKELPPYTYECTKCGESDGFEARCREIPDLCAYGETPDEAFHEIEVAVCAWLEVLQKDGVPFPAPENSLLTNELGAIEQATEPDELTYSIPVMSAMVG